VPDNATRKGKKLHLPISLMSPALRTLLVNYSIAYFRLLKDISIFYAVAGAKLAPEEKGTIPIMY
jgi:hypothetical protein